MDQHKNEFEICARDVILHQEKILVCRGKEKKYYYLPGGHVEFGEKTEEALRREIREELSLSAEKISFIGTVENIFKDDRNHHEINLIFEIAVNKINFKSNESHIEFFLMGIEEFSKKKILPIALKKAVLKWFKDKKKFWKSRRYN